MFEGEVAKFKFVFRPASKVLNEEIAEIEKKNSQTTESFKNTFKVGVSASDLPSSALADDLKRVSAPEII